jgi:hypothetical protein
MDADEHGYEQARPVLSLFASIGVHPWFFLAPGLASLDRGCNLVVLP